MKKKLFLMTILAMALSLQGASAQKNVRQFGVFDHVGIGVSAGTTGIGFQLAAPITDYLQLRAGYSYMPEYSYKTDIDYTNTKGGDGETEVEGTLHMADWNVLLDIYPFKKSGFHLTAGFFNGKERVITAENTKPVTDVDGGLEIGDYIVGFDNKGIARAAIQVKKMKPYVGIGFGRAVPRKRLSFNFEMGAQLWGSPGVYAQATNGGWAKAKSNDVDHEDDGAIDIISKITVYPVITFRINGRIF